MAKNKSNARPKGAVSFVVVGEKQVDALLTELNEAKRHGWTWKRVVSTVRADRLGCLGKALLAAYPPRLKPTKKRKAKPAKSPTPPVKDTKTDEKKSDSPQQRVCLGTFDEGSPGVRPGPKLAEFWDDENLVNICYGCTQNEIGDPEIACPDCEEIRDLSGFDPSTGDHNKNVEPDLFPEPADTPKGKPTDKPTDKPTSAKPAVKDKDEPSSDCEERFGEGGRGVSS